MYAHRKSRIIAAALAAIAALILLGPDAGAFGRRRVVVPCPPLLCEVCETAYQAGNADENIQIRVVGPEHGAIEIYYHSAAQNRDEFARDEISGAKNLHCHQSILLAPPGPYGTFAVRFGHRHDMFKVYGWKKTATAPEMNGPITLEPGHHVHLEWVTPRILRATAHDKEMVLRFNDADKAWSVLYKNF